MASYASGLWPGAARGPGPGRASRLSSRSRSSSSSASSRSSSRSRGGPRRSPSRPRSRRRHQRKFRRYSRSYSRSRSRSRGRRPRETLPPRGPRRSYRPPSRGRSRSRGRSYYRRAYLGARERRYYGFGRTVYPEAHKSWRHRSRSRSRSRTPLRLSEKDRMELLEIAKANAAKALGTANIDLPASLRTGSLSKDTNYGRQIQGDTAKLELSGRLNEDLIKTANESSAQQRSLPFSSSNSVANSVLQKTAKETAESPKEDEKSQNTYGQWVPVKKEENSLLLSSKMALSFKF
ncbi:arginine/serine-rich protein 1 [Macrotis lagotis]|uniref:arginine/serine-rich protein 1 n=1 Tax=Macrotis lagotis TaxID=92651 RepID=UPI003D69A1F3